MSLKRSYSNIKNSKFYNNYNLNTSNFYDISAGIPILQNVGKIARDVLPDIIENISDPPRSIHFLKELVTSYEFPAIASYNIDYVKNALDIQRLKKINAQNKLLAKTTAISVPVTSNKTNLLGVAGITSSVGLLGGASAAYYQNTANDKNTSFSYMCNSLKI